MKFSSIVAASFICSATLSSALVIPRNVLEPHRESLDEREVEHEPHVEPPKEPHELHDGHPSQGLEHHPVVTALKKGLEHAAKFVDTAQGGTGDIGKGSAHHAGMVLNYLHNNMLSSGSEQLRRDLELLTLRDYYEDLVQRGYDEDFEVFERSFEEEVDARDLYEYEFEARGIKGELDIRDFGDEFWERDLEGDELGARDIDEGLDARDWGEELMEREFDYELDARDFEEYELMARDIIAEELDARDLGEELMERDFEGYEHDARDLGEFEHYTHLDIFERALEEMHARAFDEELDARDFDEHEFEARGPEGARDFIEEVDARDFIGDGLLMEREFEDYELEARDFEDFELDARARDFEIDELD
ncbi:hypothetical protein H0H92_007523 [Tricholoma furcatifolium]|nr:hypothetical protein H0H92_007523 [Tricholoma furcatifolium]